jgi:hypothetical protein
MISSLGIVGASGASGVVPGPDVYYYSSAGSTPSTQGDYYPTMFMGAPITCTNAGQITKIGFYGSVYYAADYKLSISTDGGSTRAECGIISVGTGAAAWHDLTLTTPISVSASAVVRVYYIGNVSGDGSARWFYGATSGGYYVASTYAAGCTDALPSGGGGYSIGVRVYVD